MRGEEKRISLMGEERVSDLLRVQGPDSYSAHQLLVPPEVQE